MVFIETDCLYQLQLSPAAPWEAGSVWLSKLSPQRQARLPSYSNPMERASSLYGELLIRCVACRTLGLQNRDLCWETGRAGKPYFKGLSDLHFNLSHAGDRVVLALSARPIGVDLETLGPVVSPILRQCFTPEEQRYVKTAPQQMARRFYEIWTRREAYGKYTGQGLSSLPILPLPDAPQPDQDALGVFLSTEQAGAFILTLCRRDLRPLSRFQITQQVVDSWAVELEPLPQPL